MKVPTINLQGKAYAQVKDRVEQFHKDHADGSIETSAVVEEGFGLLSATISWGERKFNGHSYGKVASKKDFEKIETAAVGRALAFAGYLAGGEIASYDDMVDAGLVE